MWHSCGRWEIDDHFEDKDPAVRDLFEDLRTMIVRCGPVTCYAQKTRIVFQARARFAGVQVRKRWLVCGLWFKRRVDRVRFYRIDRITATDFAHYCRLQRASDLDDELAELLAEAYRVGCQEA